MDASLLKWHRRLLLYGARVVSLVVKGYRQNNIPVRATALAYTTLLCLGMVVLVPGGAFGGGLKGAFPQKFLSDEAARLFLQNFQLFGDYVTKETGVQVRIEVRPDTSTLLQDLEKGQLDFCFGFTDLEGLKLRESGPLTPFLSVSPFRDLPQNGFRRIVVIKKQPTTPDLKGWTVSPVEDYGERYKSVPTLFAEILIREGIPMKLARQAPQETPSRIQVLEFGQSRNLLIKVLSQEKMAAIIDEEAYLLMARRNPKIQELLEILKATGPIPITPLFVRRDLIPSLTAVKKALLKMHEDPEGEEILRTLRVGKWVEVGEADFQPLRELVDHARKLGIPLMREEYAALH